MGAAEADALWLETLQLVAARAAHELKGALNGVSVNLAVVRGRAAAAAHPASAVSRFAESAASQLDVVIGMNEALLALARRPREPVDVGASLRHVAALLVPVAQAAGTPVTVGTDADGVTLASTTAAVTVRSLLARGLMAVIDAGGGTVHLSADGRGTIVRMAAVDGEVALDARAARAAVEAGVRMIAEGSTLTLTFPVAAPIPAQTGTPTHGIA